MRLPAEVMRPERMGATFPTRLSFMRLLVRRLHREQWQIESTVFDLDDQGYGHATVSYTHLTLPTTPYV